MLWCQNTSILFVLHYSNFQKLTEQNAVNLAHRNHPHKKRWQTSAVPCDHPKPRMGNYNVWSGKCKEYFVAYKEASHDP